MARDGRADGSHVRDEHVGPRGHHAAPVPLGAGLHAAGRPGALGGGGAPRPGGGDARETGAAFELRPLPPGALQLENQLYRLVFDEETRLLRSVTNKISGTALPVEISFAAFKSEVFR